MLCNPSTAIAVLIGHYVAAGIVWGWWVCGLAAANAAILISIRWWMCRR